MRRAVVIGDMAQVAAGRIVLICAKIRAIVPPDRDLPNGLLCLKIRRMADGPSERDRSAIYLDCLPLFTSGRARLIDNARLVAQFAALARRTFSTGRDRVDHGLSGRDDACNAAAGARCWRPAQRIIAHYGLDWDERCLAFHQTERPVRTASATQVRQPIYNSAIGRWRVCEPFFTAAPRRAGKLRSQHRGGRIAEEAP
jgi:hypothetical protein